MKDKENKKEYNKEQQGGEGFNDVSLLNTDEQPISSTSNITVHKLEVEGADTRLENLLTERKLTDDVPLQELPITPKENEVVEMQAVGENHEGGCCGGCNIL
jgi:hypothetical protein